MRNVEGETNMSQRDDVILKLKELIADVSQLGMSPDEIDNDADIVTRLGLQSTQILEVMVELENHFGIEFEDTEITEELWGSIPSLADGVLAKQGA